MPQPTTKKLTTEQEALVEAIANRVSQQVLFDMLVMAVTVAIGTLVFLTGRGGAIDDPTMFFLAIFAASVVYSLTRLLRRWR